MLYALGVLIFAVGLLLSIALHEIGHLVPAKRFGVKVTQYMVGFGPTLWSRRRGDTEYGFKAIPLGGYIRMIGMVPPRRRRQAAPAWPRRMASAIEDFRPVSRVRGQARRRAAAVLPAHPRQEDHRHARRPDDEPADLPGAHRRAARHPRHRARGHRPPQWRSVSKCVVAGHRPGRRNRPTAPPPTRRPTSPACSPATASWRSTVRRSAAGTRRVWVIEASPGRPLAVSVRARRRAGHAARHAGREHQVRQRRRHRDEAGRLHRGQRPGRPLLPGAVASRRCPGTIGSQVALGLHAMGQLPAKIASLWHTVFEGEPRDPNGAVGVVGIGRLGGDFDPEQAARRCRTRSSLLIGLLAERQPAAVLLQPAAAAAAGRRARRRARWSRRPSAAAPGCAHVAAAHEGDPEPARADLRRHRADAAGDVRGGFRADRGDAAHALRRHRQADQPRRRMADVTTRMQLGQPSHAVAG